MLSFGLSRINTLLLRTSMQDLRYAWRIVRTNRGVAAAVICTLALGIGINTSIFDVINGVILRPLPYPNADQLVSIEETTRGGEFLSFSYPDYRDCARQTMSFQGVAAWRNRGANLTSPGEATFIPVRQVSASFLDTLGVHVLLGRNFSADEDEPGAAPVAVIDYSLWKQRFESRNDVVGSRVILNGKGYTVVGILPPGFQFFDRRPILTLMGQDDEVGMQSRDFHSGIQVIARLKPGLTLRETTAEMRIIGQRLASAYPQNDANIALRAVSLKEQMVGDVRNTLFLLGGAVCFVLLIACVNVANLFLTRAIAREREFAIREALGAGRWRMIRQLITESLLLSVLGGGAGFLGAALSTRWMIAHLPQWLPRANEILIDVPVLLFTMGVSILCGIAFGITPAFRREFHSEQALRQRAYSTGHGARRVQAVFVVAELALALMLLTGAGLMMRSVMRIWAVSPGFDPHKLLTMRLALPPGHVNNPASIRNGWYETLNRVQHTPGLEAAALDSILPLTGDTDTIAYWTTAATQPPKDASQAFLFTPTPDYLRVMKISLLRGRFFTEQDRVGTEPVIVIDETLATRVFPGSDPVGQELSVELIGRARVIGVVRPIKHRILDEDNNSRPQPAIYVAFSQIPDQFMRLTTTGMYLLVRTSTNPSSVVQAVKDNAVGPARDAPVRNVRTMEQIIEASTAQRRGIAFLLGIFASLALILSAIGIYSVISYAMSRRVNEIGLRMALGAQPRDVLKLVFVNGAGMLAAGLGSGLACSFAITRLLRKVLFEVPPADPTTFLASVAVLSCVALLAIYIPARRATRTDPAIVLRYE